MTLHDPMRRTERLIEESAGDDVVIYDRDTDRVIALDATDARLWRASDGTRSVADLATLAELTEVEAVTSLARLEAAGLMAEDGMSRRGMLTKMGLVGAGVGVAGFASILAPVAAHAATGLPAPLNGGEGVIAGVSVSSPVINFSGAGEVSLKGGVASVPPMVGTGFGSSTNVTVNVLVVDGNGNATQKSIPVLTNDDGSLYVAGTKIPDVSPGATFQAVAVAAGGVTSKPLKAVLGH